MRVVVAFLLVFLLQACKHPLIIVGEGDIVDLNGSEFGCSLEQFRAGDAACTENEVTADYLVNYRAMPRPGWRFVRWEGACGHLSEAPDCRFEAPAAWVAIWDDLYAEVAVGSLSAIFEQSAPPVTVEYTEDRVPCANQTHLRDAFFGDLHIHTTFSMDAWTWRTTLEPRDSYAHAKSIGLDFAAATDHSEFLGEMQLCNTQGSPGYEDGLCITLRDDSLTSTERRQGLSTQNTSLAPFREIGICGDDAEFCVQEATAQWQKIRDQAAEHYDPMDANCDFTTFVAYEWTGAIGGNTHRNVIFRNDDVPGLPISHFEAPVPERLWSDLETQCLDADSGRCDALAIPHNSNAGNGWMFRSQYFGANTVDEEIEIATRRIRVEPIMELFQHKGQSECIPGFIDAFGMVDELCDFEDAVAGHDQGVAAVAGDYLRGALGTGFSEQARLGVNPYKFGVIASTDTHGGATTVDEANYNGNLGPTDAQASNRLRGKSLIYNPGGLAGIWAVENSRDALFESLLRREVFGTSGPRITPRAYGAWEFDASACERVDRLAYADAVGVPMGGELGARPVDAVPSFAVWAAADLVPLQQLQIVKSYLDADHGPQTAVYTVAGDPDNGASVDTDSCEIFPGGAMELCAVWSDPDFDTTQAASYYVRVIEDPSCRWSTRDCNSLPQIQQDNLEGCQPDVPKTVQERAWTSPIWYTPE